jgi:hypothetical protein
MVAGQDSVITCQHPAAAPSGQLDDFARHVTKGTLRSGAIYAQVWAPDETAMASLPVVDELLRSVAELERLGKERIKERQGIKGRCECSCHTDVSIIHIGPLCCERAVPD